MKVNFRVFSRGMFEDYVKHLQKVAAFATLCDEFLISIESRPDGNAVVWFWEYE